MSRKIYYINDLGFTDGYISNVEIERLPLAHMIHHPWYSVRWNSIEREITGENNVIIIQTPVHDEKTKLQIALNLSEKNHVFVSQEGNIFEWFEWDATEQELYIRLLSESIAFLHHSDFDKKVMSVFVDRFVKWNGCINFSTDSPKTFEDCGEYISLPTPIKRYQRGMITHKLAVDVIKDIPIYSSAYNRPSGIHMLSFPDSYKLDGISLVPRMNLDTWLSYINNSKFGIDIHREFSGGNCSLEYAALGVPLIGNINLDTQADLFPNTSFDYLDYDGIKNAIHLLLHDKDFYEDVSKNALDVLKNQYYSSIVVEKFRSDFEKVLSEVVP